MQAKWEEMFGEKKEDVVEEVRAKKPRKNTDTKKIAEKTASSNKAPAKRPAIFKKIGAKKPTAKNSER